MNDFVKLTASMLPSAPQFRDFAQVTSISSLTINELIVNYNDGVNIVSANVDATWVIAVYRPITS